VVLTVVDTGIGISAKDLPRIFERFYASTRSGAGTSGHRLGLSVVRHIALAHGGTVEATSALGTGSTFTLTIPMHTEPPTG